MKGYRFFADNGGENSKSGSKKHRPFTRRNLRDTADHGRQVNCIALFVNDDGRYSYTPGKDVVMEGLAAVFGTSNSGVNVTGVSQEYLRKHCVRIPENLARKLHPALFARLDG